LGNKRETKGKQKENKRKLKIGDFKEQYAFKIFDLVALTEEGFKSSIKGNQRRDTQYAPFVGA